ncbi:MAG: pyrroline-5-carboxylate reductase [Sphingomonadales bacterium CG12_big_fil_rev_8_21_14_0_65_65_10]|uniref:pyrroline-5-carboxylate reductase family protein n=1 Tax=Blastomonas marina TaxID=1867408 RepID=UPI000CC79AE6|nr:pyrroline-5-carboxylate reductase [Blastomonas marina]PIW54111.1 MAG: pyrroline-5-carboxylate reductase [Sphingomonadales bacterium CG12_big_fil_rev_8_21_14_0_65_65_10]WPZ02777.1 pyrroline-5-carboxylate reductase [Blastomonas marina]
MFERILVCGFGNMASAMVEGWIAGGIPPHHFTIYNPRPKTVPQGTKLVTDIPPTPFDALVLGFKPHMLADVAPKLGPASNGATIISILAGVDLDSLRKAFPNAGKVIRLMPNLACALGKSPIALAGRSLTEKQREAVEQLAKPLGPFAWVDEENYELTTALGGSGPAFVYRFIDAIAGAATDLGLDREEADKLALAMVDGATQLAVNSRHSPGELAKRVASPGGMTQKGMDVLDEGDALRNLLRDTLAAARDRGTEMAEEARKSGK